MMMRKTAGLLAFFGMCLGTHAVTYVSDDFNDGAVSGDWIIANSATNSTATEDGAESDFTADPGGGSLKLNDQSDTTEVWLQYVLPDGIDEGESLTLQFDYYSVNATLPMLYIEDGAADAARLNLLGDLNHRNGGSWETLLAGAASNGHWYRITYTFHNHAGVDKADVTFQPFGGSASTWTGLDVQSSKTSVDTVTFGFNTGNQNIAREWWIDNITISSEAVFDPDTWFETLRTERVESDPSIVWRQFGPGMSGNNYRIYWHPTDPDVVFLGPNMGNAYRSEDRGTTYEGILDYDGKGHAFDERGPSELNSPDFSRQHPDLGFCSREAESKLYKTTNRGRTWTRMMSTESVWDGKRLNTIAIAPTDDQIWYVGSGDINDRNKFYFTAANPHGYGSASGHEAKIWKTADQGQTWIDITPAGINSDACIVRIIVHPEDADTVWAATTYGLYKSTNGGTSWTAKTGTGLDNDIIRSFDMHYDPDSGDITLFAVDQVIWADAGNTVTNAGGGIFRSLDEGESWQNINGDLGVDIAVLKSDYQFKNSYFNALEKWFEIPDAESVYTVYPTHLLNNFSMVRVDPNDADKIFVLNDYKHYGGSTTFRGGMVWRTDDGGAHWYATLRNGTAWEGKHKSYWEGRGNPTAHNMFLRGQKKWEQRDSYERKAGSAIEFNADGTMLMFQWAKTLVVSVDGGDTWEEIDEIEVAPHSEIWVAAENSNLPGHGLKQDPRFPDTIFLPSGENDFWVIEPGGDSVRSGYQAARRVEMGSSEYSCSDVAIHPTDTNIIYTLQFRQASAGDLLKSTDGGQTFAEHGVALEWPPGESENTSIDQLCLTINPDDPDYMFFCVPDDAAVHGYTWDPRISLTTGVRRTTDGGLNWEWANNGLPAEDVVCLRLDPNNSSNLFACVYGNNGGLYISTDNAASWSTYTKLPGQIYSVSDLHFSSDGKMYVSCGKHNDYDVDEGGVWMSDDDGNSWTQIFKTHWARMTKTAVYDPDVILVQMNSKGTSDIQNPGTYLSKDGGASWSKINTGNPQSDRVNDIAIDQVVSNRYYVSTQGCGWLRGDLVDTNNVAPVFSGSSIVYSNSVPEVLYVDTLSGEASDPNGDSVTYALVYGPDWLNVAGNGSLSGTPPAGAVGRYFCQVQADDSVGMSSRETMYFMVSTNPSVYFASWLRDFPGVGSEDGFEEDPDGDGLNNLDEYAFGGNPEIAGVPADILPTFGNGVSGLEYVYRARKDADQRGLVYNLETTADLASGIWTNIGFAVDGIGEINADFQSVTNTVSTTESTRFLRLDIQLAE